MKKQVALETVVDAYVQTLRNSLYFTAPGTVVSFDAKSQTASVQPMTNDVRRDIDTDETVYEPWPVIPNVRIAWPRWGSFCMVGQLPQWAPVVLQAFDLDPTSAFAAGQSNKPADPADVRRHAGSYWFAFPTNLLGPIKDAASLASLVALLGLDGDTAQILFALGALTLGKTGSNVSIAGGANPLVPAPWATALASGLSSFAGTVSGITPPSTLPQVVAAFGTLITAAGTLSTALGNLPADATTATKAT